MAIIITTRKVSNIANLPLRMRILRFFFIVKYNSYTCPITGYNQASISRVYLSSPCEGIRVGLMLRIRGELLLIILHHLEETVPTYSAESITVRVA